jgi:hypothetical protein
MLADSNSRDDTVATARALLPQAQIIENTAGVLVQPTTWRCCKSKRPSHCC